MKYHTWRADVFVGSEVVADESNMMTWVFCAGLIAASFSEILLSD
jgi:hypothetical protein